MPSEGHKMNISCDDPDCCVQPSEARLPSCKCESSAVVVSCPVHDPKPGPTKEVALPQTALCRICQHATHEKMCKEQEAEIGLTCGCENVVRVTYPVHSLADKKITVTREPMKLESRPISTTACIGLDRLADELYNNSQAKGFTEVANTSAIHTQLLMMVGEICEAQEEIRSGHGVHEVYVKEGKPEGFGVELADALIRILNFCGAHNIEIGQLVKMKADYNMTREPMHGRKF